jgi:hypothetical protein
MGKKKKGKRTNNDLQNIRRRWTDVIWKGNLFTKLYHVKVYLVHITISWNRTHTLIAIINIEYPVVRKFQNILNYFVVL